MNEKVWAKIFVGKSIDRKNNLIYSEIENLHVLFMHGINNFTQKASSKAKVKSECPLLIP